MNTETLGILIIFGVTAAVLYASRRPKKIIPAQDKIAGILEVQHHRTSHFLHLVLSIISAGFWLPVWLVVSANNCWTRNRINKRNQLNMEFNFAALLIILLVIAGLVLLDQFQ